MPRIRPSRTARDVEWALLGGTSVDFEDSPTAFGSEQTPLEPEPEPELEPELVQRPVVDGQTDDSVLRHDEVLTHAQVERERIRAALAQTKADAAAMLQEQNDRQARALAEQQPKTVEELASLENARVAAEAQVRMVTQAQDLLQRLGEPAMELSSWESPIVVRERDTGVDLLGEIEQEELRLQLELRPEPAHDAVYAKLTDPTQFTGHHKHRFDQQTGKGLGKAELGAGIAVGAVEKHHEYVELLKEAKHQKRIADLQERADRMEQWAVDKRWREEEQMEEDKKKSRAQEERAERARQRRLAADRRKAAENVALRELQERYTMTDADQWSSPISGARIIAEAVPQQIPYSTAHYKPAQEARTSSAPVDRGGSRKSTRSSARSGAATSRGERRSSPSIFDKLTDHAQFTGTHKARFDASGRGRGKPGRSESPKAMPRAERRKPQAAGPPGGRQLRRKAGGGGKRSSKNGSVSPTSFTRSEASGLSLTSAEESSTGQNEATTPPSGQSAFVASSTTGTVQATQRDEERVEQQQEGSSDGEDPVDFLIARRAQSVERATAAARSRARDEKEIVAASHRVAAHNLRASAARVEHEGDAAEAARKMSEGIAQLEAALSMVQPIQPTQARNGASTGTFV